MESLYTILGVWDFEKEDTQRQALEDFVTRLFSTIFMQELIAFYRL